MLLALLPAAPAHAVDLSGSAIVSTGTTSQDGSDSDVLDQQYSFTLFQRLTPYLAFRLGHLYSDFSTESTGGADFSRRSREPRFELLYDRDRFSAAVSLLDRESSGSSEVDRLEIRSLIGRLQWRPLRGPTVALRFRDEANVADAALFGRDTDNRSLSLDTVYSRRYWSTSYSYLRSELENNRTRLVLEQDQHRARLDASRRFFGDRLSLAVGSQVSRLDREEVVPAGAELAEVVPARQGLFAVDTSPDAGELQPAPGVTDGDFATPAGPLADVGGANTFRNFGVDLGLTLPLTRLEVAVDAPSGPEVVWQVWHSPDNLLWERVDAVTRDFDSALLRYTLRFPEVTDRYFKAVNVTVNSAVDVRVTELRALREVDRLAPPGEATLYRADVSLGYTPSDRVSLRVDAGASEDETTAGGLLRRRFEETHAGARVDVGVTEEVRLRAGYRYLDFESGADDPLLRTETVTDLALVWSPLATVDATLAGSRREELEEGEPIRLLEVVRLTVRTELLPDLDLRSELEQTWLEDPLAGFERQGWSWRETLSARPTPRWDLDGTFALLRYEDEDGTPLLDRRQWGLRASWLATPFVVLIGSWDVTQDADRESLRQAYSASWSPGGKLSLAASWESFEDERLRQTSTGAVTGTYRLTARFSLFGTLTRSDFEEQGAEDSEVTSLRTGITFFF